MRFSRQLSYHKDRSSSLGMTVSRRTLLEWAIRVSATPAGVQFFSQWIRGAQSHSAASHGSLSDDFLANYQPRFFSPRDFEALESFTEILIPTDETPGARQARCAQFIDFLLSSMGSFSPESQQQWRTALSTLDGSGFHAATLDRRKTLVAEFAAPEQNPSLASSPAFAAYLLIKRETIFAFYTSRAGTIGALDYRGNTYNVTFPACTHPEHHEL
jgi:Gluconate 2-dehydrogenase subunit 3